MDAFIFMTGSHITDDEIKAAEDKFAESLQLAQTGMFNLLENDVSWIKSLFRFNNKQISIHHRSNKYLSWLRSPTDF